MCLKLKLTNKTLWTITKWLSISFMIGQSITLIRAFLLNDTLLTVDNSHQDNVIPGITVCYPRAISLYNSLQSLNKQSDLFLIREAFGKDQAFFDTLRVNDFDRFNEYYMNRSEQGDSQIIRLMKVLETRLNKSREDISKLVGEQVKFTFADYLYWTIISSLEVFTPKSPSEIFHSSIPFTKIKYTDKRQFNMMIKKHFIERQPKEDGYPIDVSVYGLIEQDGHLGENMVKLIDEEPVESIIFNDESDWKKCFIFFSQLKHRWRTTRMLVNNINIDVFHKPFWFPSLFFKYESFTFSMHNPSELATKSIGIESFKDVKIEYQVMVTDQTQSEGIVNCEDYDLTSDQWWRRTRTDCVKKCLQERQEECSQCSTLWGKCFFEGYDQWTRDQMNDQLLSFVSLDSTSSQTMAYVARCNASRLHFETVCRHVCRPKCVDRQYNYHIKSSDSAFASRVEIQHQNNDKLSKVVPRFITISKMIASILNMRIIVSWWAILIIILVISVLLLIICHYWSVLKKPNNVIEQAEDGGESKPESSTRTKIIKIWLENDNDDQSVFEIHSYASLETIDDRQLPCDDLDISYCEWKPKNVF